MADSNNYIVTAADRRYFKNLRQLIFTFKRSKECQNSELIIYDLGLNPGQISELQELQLDAAMRVHYRLFPFGDYPDFVRPEHHTYSWKPILIHLTANEFQGNFLWMDSANCILKKLGPVWDEIRINGTFAPLSGAGTLKEWTVQATLDYLDVSEHYYTKRNRAGNTFGFTNTNETVRELLERWKDLALIRECIRPQGASRANHRDDQSLLTILLLEQEEEGNLILTADEVNISSGRPTSFVSVRNRFPTFPKLQPGNTANMYFQIARRLDIVVNRIKGN